MYRITRTASIKDEKLHKEGIKERERERMGEREGDGENGTERERERAKSGDLKRVVISR